VHLEIREQSTGAQRIIDRLKDGGFVAAGKDLHGGTSDVTFERVG
jgi:hypothetical protein